MKTYFFVLGTNHSLSKVDIVNVLTKRGEEPKIVAASEELLVVETKETLEATDLMKELGSAAKMGEIFSAKPDFEEVLESVKMEEFNDFGEIKNFGISVYGAGGKVQKLNEILYLVPKLVDRIKKEHPNLGYIRRQGRELSSVTVDKNHLLDQGFEMVLGVGEEGIFLGRTLAIQDYEGYSQRDYERPARDPKAGMIPPKLAKMMVNLALKDKDALILDPFCGSGTMLQEMILLGYTRLIGSDSSEKSVRDTETNLNWLFAKFGLNKKDYDIKVFKQDVQKLSSKVSFKTVDAIVTEPYLGSPQARGFHLGQIEKEVAKLGKLYLAAFGEFRKVLRDDGVIVMIFPVFRFKSQLYYLDIMDGIYALGFKKRVLIPNPPTGGERLNLNLTSRGSIIFFRPGQTVSREIFVFSRQ